MFRNDIQGEARPPASILHYLLAKGGKNIYGEPNYRLVWSPTRMKRQGGRWQDWDKSRTANERGGMMMLESGVIIPSIYKPERTVIEIRTVKKYNFRSGGWVLERWIPVEYYGSEVEWNRRCVPGTSVPLGGPWPLHGDFEMCHHSPAEEMPGITELQNAIDRCEKSRDKRKLDVRQLVLERENEAAEEYEAQMKQESDARKAMMHDIMTPFYGGSLTAGALRSRAAERAGIRTHVGN
jgi:hypothetical protein